MLHGFFMAYVETSGNGCEFIGSSTEENIGPKSDSSCLPFHLFVRVCFDCIAWAIH